MSNGTNGLYFEIQVLADALEALSLRAKAAIFGACGQALAPLVREVEQATQGRWSFPDIDHALNVVEKYATGVTGQADYSELRARLMASMPHGDDLDAPWSTYVQDALICIDAGLATVSIDGHLRSIWIQYALEPQMASMQMRDVDLIRARGDEYWARFIVDDPLMADLLMFLRESITVVSREELVGQTQYRRMVEKAAVLRPI